MKVFLSYTVRDGFIDSRVLEELEKHLSPKWSIYIDLLHNKSASPQKEVLTKLAESDLVIQIVTPSISDSEWACLEKDLALMNGIPVGFVNYGQQSLKQLAKGISEVIASNKHFKSEQKQLASFRFATQYSQLLLSA